MQKTCSPQKAQAAGEPHTCNAGARVHIHNMLNNCRPLLQLWQRRRHVHLRRHGQPQGPQPPAGAVQGQALAPAGCAAAWAGPEGQGAADRHTPSELHGAALLLLLLMFATCVLAGTVRQSTGYL
jgi:hypothetical protein